MSAPTRWDRRPVPVLQAVKNSTALCVTQKKILLEVQSLKGVTRSAKPNQEHSRYRPPFGVERPIGDIHLEHKEIEKPKSHSHQTKKTSRNMSPDIQSLQDTLFTSLSLNDDAMGRTDEPSLSMDNTTTTTEAGYSLFPSFLPLVCSDYVTHFGVLNQAYLPYDDEITPNLDLVNSPHKPALEATEIDLEELETLLNRYSPDVKWEDLPWSVQEYYVQQAQFEQLGDLCDKMEGVNMSQEQNYDWIAGGMYFVEDEIVEGDDSIFTVENTTMPPSLGDGLVQKLETLTENTAENSSILQSPPEPTLQHTPRVTTTDSADGPTPANESSSMQGLKGLEFWDADAQVRLRQLGLGHNELFQTLNALNASREPFFDAICTNPPLNVSTPCTYPCHLADVMEEAKGMTSRFGEVDKLAMEVENNIESRRAQHRLSAFVDQWITA